MICCRGQRSLWVLGVLVQWSREGFKHAPHVSWVSQRVSFLDLDPWGKIEVQCAWNAMDQLAASPSPIGTKPKQTSRAHAYLAYTMSHSFSTFLLCTSKQTNGGRRHDSPPATTRQHPPPSRPPSPPPRPPLASPRPPPRLPSSPLLLILLFTTIIITTTTHPSFRDDQDRLLLRLRPRPWSDPRRSQTCLPRTRQEHPPGRQSYHGHHQRIPRHQRGV